MDMFESAEIEIAQIPTAQMNDDFITEPLGPGDLEDALFKVILFG